MKQKPTNYTRNLKLHEYHERCHGMQQSCYNKCINLSPAVATENMGIMQIYFRATGDHNLNDFNANPRSSLVRCWQGKERPIHTFKSNDSRNFLFSSSSLAWIYRTNYRTFLCLSAVINMYIFPARFGAKIHLSLSFRFLYFFQLDIKFVGIFWRV